MPPTPRSPDQSPQTCAHARPRRDPRDPDRPGRHAKCPYGGLKPGPSTPAAHGRAIMDPAPPHTGCTPETFTSTATFSSPRKIVRPVCTIRSQAVRGLRPSRAAFCHKPRGGVRRQPRRKPYSRHIETNLGLRWPDPGPGQTARPAASGRAPPRRPHAMPPKRISTPRAPTPCPVARAGCRPPVRMFWTGRSSRGAPLRP